MLEGRHYQNAYVTRDIDQAIAAFRARADIGEVRAFEATTESWTPSGMQTIVSRLAFIWIDDLQIELIQPIAGASEIYADALPAGDEMKFHHICMKVDDWDGFRARVDEQGLPVVLERATAPELKFLYLDARAFLGHYIEYVWMTDAMWTRMGGR